MKSYEINEPRAERATKSEAEILDLIWFRRSECLKAADEGHDQRLLPRQIARSLGAARAYEEMHLVIRQTIAEREGYRIPRSLLDTETNRTVFRPVFKLA